MRALPRMNWGVPSLRDFYSLPYHRLRSPVNWELPASVAPAFSER